MVDHIWSHWSPYHQSVLQTIESFTSLLSLLAIACMIYKINYDNKKSKMFFTNKLLLIMFAINIILLFFYLIGLSASGSKNFCIFQAFMVQWFGLAEMMWVTCMTYHLFGWIVEKKSVDSISKLLFKNAGIVLAASFIIAFILLMIPDVYGPSETWCWIRPDYTIIRFSCYYVIQLACMISIITLIIYMVYVIQSSLTSIGGETADVDELAQSEERVRRKLYSYVLVFVFVWFFALLNGFVSFVGEGIPTFGTSVLQVLFLPLQGFLLSLFFGNLIKTIERMFMRCRGRSTAEVKVNNHEVKKLEMTITEVNNDAFKFVNRFSSISELKRFSVFVSTFNLGEASIEETKASMVDWILPGHDIYVLGFQECLDVMATRMLILDSIGGPQEYSMFTSEIGSGNTKLGYHGYIAITVYIRNRDLIEGNVRPTLTALGTLATGANLIVTTGSNKGGVGIPIQIHDTNIGFIVTHLPSDSKGVSKLGKRNGSAQKILSELNLCPEHVGFDCHLQHDHMIFMGDLNYRMDTTGVGGGVSTLTGVSVACLVEKHTLGEDPNWFRRRYQLLRAPCDPLFPSASERQLMQSARQASKGAWQSVLRADELHAIMEDGDVFFGFFELMPCFPPSYKRKTGAASKCGDYCDPLVMIKGFSNTGEVEADIVSITVAPKRQSLKNNAANDTSASEVESEVTTSSTVETSSSNKESSSAVADDSASGDEGASQNGVTKSRMSRRTNVSTVCNDNEESQTPQELPPFNAGTNSAADQTAEVVPKKPVERKPISAKEAKKIRPPSYTDRILLYSQEDRKSQIHLQAYDFCDTMTVSDHKPVTMVFSVLVNPKVKFHDNGIDLNNTADKNQDETGKHIVNNAAGFRKMREEIKTSLYEVSIIDLSVNFNNSTGIDVDLQDEPDDDEEDSNDAEFSSDLEAGWGKDALGDSNNVANPALSTPKTSDSSKASKRLTGISIKQEAKKKAKNDKEIANLIVVCPLPTKDPLIVYKKMNEIAEAFNISDSSIMRKYEEIANRMMKPASKSSVDVTEYIDNPLRLPNKNSLSNNNDSNQPDTQVEIMHFSRPASTFPWIEQSAALSNRRHSISKSAFVTLPQQQVAMKFTCVITPNLGGNILLKFVNKAEVTLGECSLCISHLLPTNQSTILKSKFSQIPLSSGGQKRGDASMVVMVRLLSDEQVKTK